MNTSTHKLTIKSLLRLISSILFLSAGLTLLIPAAKAVCTSSSSGSIPRSILEAHRDEITAMGDLHEADFQIGLQKIYRLRKSAEQDTRDPWLERLKALKPRLEVLQRHFPTEAEREAARREERERRERDPGYRLPYMPTPPNRTVLLVESELDLLGDTLAFTHCALEDETNYFIRNHRDLLRELPRGLCLLVVRPHTIDGERKKKFVLSHEWMHTMQNGSYDFTADSGWWVEGSAEWGAHKVVEGTTERNNKIEQFFERQPDCSLTDHTYDAQTFFFWGEQSFGIDWGISLGMGGPDYLDTPRRAAEMLHPEQWLDWAISQADHKITMPDGRDLPSQAEVELLDLTHSCEAAIEGPPLSVQLRELRFPEDSAPLLTIDPQGAQLAYRAFDADDAGRPSAWTRVTEAVELEPSEGPLLLAAIMPSGEPLRVQIKQENSDRANCACHIGRWMEQPTADSEAQDSFKGALEAIEKARAFVPPEQLEELEKAKRMISSSDTKDRFRFRGALEEVMGMGDEVELNYNNPGPTVTFKGGGKFIIEDPYSFTSNRGKVDYITSTFYGRWEIRQGILKIDLQRFAYEMMSETSESDGPIYVSGDNVNSTYVGGGGDWIVSCEGSGIRLIPADRKERGPGKDAVLTTH